MSRFNILDKEFQPVFKSKHCLLKGCDCISNDLHFHFELDFAFEILLSLKTSEHFPFWQPTHNAVQKANWDNYSQPPPTSFSPHEDAGHRLHLWSLPLICHHDGTIVNSFGGVASWQMHRLYSFDYLFFVLKVVKMFTDHIKHESFGTFTSVNGFPFCTVAQYPEKLARFDDILSFPRKLLRPFILKCIVFCLSFLFTIFFIKTVWRT